MDIIEEHKKIKCSHISTFDEISYKTLFCKLNNIGNWKIWGNCYLNYDLFSILKAWKECAIYSGFTNHPILNVPENENAIKLYLKLHNKNYVSME